MNEEETARYLRSILTAVLNIQTALRKLNTRIDTLEQSTQQLGQACGLAFYQTKKVVQHLAEVQEETAEELSDSCGVLRENTEWYNKNIKVV